MTFQFSSTNTNAQPVGKNRILSLDPAWASLSSRDLKIACELAPEAVSASLFIFTLNGARVKTLGGLSASQGLVHWDGKWENEQPKTGVYLLVLRVDGKDEDMKKIVILSETGGF